MFNFIKNNLKKIYSHIHEKAHALFGAATIDESILKELEKLLLSADTGFKATRTILDNLKAQVANGTIEKGEDLKSALEKELLSLVSIENTPTNCDAYLLVGINGSGKTTLAAKLAHTYIQEGKKPLLVAGDTFRAAAVEQLERWAQKLNCGFVKGKPDQDPASVIYLGCETFKNGDYDVIIFDTAGRLQTKTHLMKELEKIKKVISKQLQDKKICTLLTIDAMLGQNSFEQAQLFHQSTQLDGIALTKMDGTGKGGIIFAIAQEFNIPVSYISFGEQLTDLKQFNAEQYIYDLFQ